MKLKSFRKVVNFILIISILIISAVFNTTTASSEIIGLSGQAADLPSITFWNGYTALPLTETGEVDTLVVPRLTQGGMGSSINFSVANYPYLDPKKTTIKLSMTATPNVTYTTGTVYTWYKTAEYCIVPVTAFGEFYLDVEAYDSNGTKYFRRIKVIHNP